MSDYGGEADVNEYCWRRPVRHPFCTYPWYAFNRTNNAFTYHGDYPGTGKDHG